MQLIEVQTEKHHRQFVDLPKFLYKDVPPYIPPIRKDVEQVFDRRENTTFTRGDCVRWIAVDKQKVIGRIAAFWIRRKTDTQESDLAGGIGFFECVDDQGVANLLFDTARNWLAEKGCTYMDGPVNFGKRDRWWGLLTKGYELEPNYHHNYHLPYYKGLFENYGFKVYYEHYTFHKDTRVMVHDKLQRKAEMIASDPGYEIRLFDMKNFKKQVADVVEIYNKAWVNHEGVSKMTMDQAMGMFKKMKPILDPRIMWFVYYEDQPVAFYLNLPEVNQLFKHVNGKMNLWGMLKFLWHKWTQKNPKMLGLVFGIIPEHQGKGVDGALVMESYNTLQTLPGMYDSLEISGIGDFNKKMIIVVKQVGGEICKVHSTYRYLFDRSIPFERMKPIR